MNNCLNELNVYSSTPGLSAHERLELEYVRKEILLTVHSSGSALIDSLREELASTHTNEQFRDAIENIFGGVKAALPPFDVNQLASKNTAHEHVPAYWSLLKSYYDLVGDENSEREACVQLSRLALNAETASDWADHCKKLVPQPNDPGYLPALLQLQKAHISAVLLGNEDSMSELVHENISFCDSVMRVVDSRRLNQQQYTEIMRSQMCLMAVDASLLQI